MSIEIINLEHIYSKNTPFEYVALKDITLNIEQGDFIGLIGHTGSGKSTFIQHLNGLLKPTKGSIIIDGLELTTKEVKMRKIRQKVGLVFQYPEHQLFEESVYKDVAFGPKNLGLSESEINGRVKNAIELVGLDYDTICDSSPFDLSGGQMRRVAIAGVIAMKPDVLILDEPTAGLDPRGRDEILQQIKILHEKHRITVVLVSHSMEDIAKLVNKIIVFHQGNIIFYDTPSKVFTQSEKLEEIGLAVPQVTYLMKELKLRDPQVRDDIFTVEQAREEILQMLRRKKNA